MAIGDYEPKKVKIYDPDTGEDTPPPAGAMTYWKLGPAAEPGSIGALKPAGGGIISVSSGSSSISSITPGVTVTPHTWASSSSATPPPPPYPHVCNPDRKLANPSIAEIEERYRLNLSTMDDLGALLEHLDQLADERDLALTRVAKVQAAVDNADMTYSTWCPECDDPGTWMTPMMTETHALREALATDD
jgi:hypothetical protein